MPVFHAYRRVSDEKQVDNNSLDTQDSALRKLHADKYPNHKYLEYCDPAVSALIPWFERKAGELLWSQLNRGDVVGVAAFDRAFRSLTDVSNSLEKLVERGVTVHCLDLPVDISTLEGQMVFKLLGVIKEYERKLISKRIKAVNDWKRENGIPVNTMRVLGYKRNGQRGKDFRWLPWKEEREFGQSLIILHEHDNLSFREAYLFIQRQKNKRLLNWSGRTNYNYLQLLYYAAKAGFPLPDGSYIPATAAEFLEWYKSHPAG